MKAVIIMVVIILVASFGLGLRSGYRDDRQDCVELLQDLTNIVESLEERISSIEDRPEIKIENANVFNMEDDIMIQGDN